MNIFINSPSYYTQNFGVDDEVYKLCSYIAKNMNITKYTSSIDTFAITPIIAPQNLNPEKLESKVIFVRAANISVVSSFDDYINANTDDKIKIIVDNIKKSSKILKKKLKSKFDLEMFLKDLEQLVTNY